MSFEEQIGKLELILPPAPKAVGVYRPAVEVGNLLYTSGHVPLLQDGTMLKGKVGSDVDEQAGYDAARQCGLTILATLQSHLGSLDRVVRLVKAFGLVNCTDDFVGQPQVLNGFSDLMKDVFGETAGVGARSAVGTNALPLGITVEIETIFEIKPQ